MKKYLALLLSLAFAVCLSACQAAWATCWIPREIQQGARIQIPV